MKRLASIATLLIFATCPSLTIAGTGLNPGMRMLETENAHGAEAYFKAVLQKDPDSARAMADLGKVYLTQGKDEAAVQWIKLAIAVEPQNTDLHILLGDAYSHLVNHVSWFSKLGVAHETLHAYQDAARLSPGDAKAHYRLFEYYRLAPSIAGGSSSKAKAQLAELQKLSPLMADWERADMAESHKDFKTAQSWLAHAVRLDTSGQSSNMLGLARIAEQDYVGAIKVFERGIRKDPGDTDNLYQLGRACLLGKMDLDKGAQAFSRYLALPHSWYPGTPDYKWARYRLGEIYGLQGKADLQKSEYLAALKIDPDFKQARKALQQLAGEH